MSAGESGSFRRSAFGGFNRDDVVGYIEKYSSEHRACVKENEKLRSKNDELSARIEELERLLTEKEAENEQLRAVNAELDAMRGDFDRVKDSADEYEKTRLRLASIEVEAARRAANIEKIAMDAAENTLDDVEAVTQDINDRYGKIRQEIDTTMLRLRAELSRMGESLDMIVGELDETQSRLKALKDSIRAGREKTEGKQA